MHEEVRQILKRILHELTAVPNLEVEPSSYLVYKRVPSGGWSSEYEERPKCASWKTLPAQLLDKYADELSTMLKNHHPDHCGMIGCSAVGSWSFNPAWYLSWMVSDIVEEARHDEFDSAIDKKANDFATIIDSEDVFLDFTAPLINFAIDGEVSDLELSKGFHIHRLTDEEVTELYGGFLPNNIDHHDHFGIDDFAIIGTLQDKKNLTEEHHTELFDSFVHSLDRIVVGLRTYQSGRVGFNRVRFKARGLFKAVLLRGFLEMNTSHWGGIRSLCQSLKHSRDMNNTSACSYIRQWRWRPED